MPRLFDFCRRLAPLPGTEGKPRVARQDLGYRFLMIAILMGCGWFMGPLVAVGQPPEAANRGDAPAVADRGETPVSTAGAAGDISSRDLGAAAESPLDGDSVSDSSAAGSIDDEVRLRLNFNATPWPEVLEWFVEETGMSLQRDNWPAGSFTYNDPRRRYTISEALDAMNLVLGREGYALVRRGQLLLVVDLEAENIRDYLREIADTVSPSQLDSRAKSDYVRVVFPLGGLDPEGAVEDLEKLRSPAGSVQFLATSRAIVAADTVGVLKSIRDVMMASDTTDGGVMEYQLQNRPAEDILELARPHLGLEPGENSGEDISLSTNLLGDRIYATGDPSKLRILKGLIEKGDSPLPEADESATAALEPPELRTYTSGSADPSVVLEVLQRLLAGMPDVRLTLDPETQAIIAYGRPTDHRLIRETLDKMGGEGADQLKVIPLRRLDPQAALLTINKYFGKTADNDVGPTVDGDPETKRLWVKGTASQVAEVERLIQELEGTSGDGLIGERIRLLPYSGRSAEEALNQLERLWQMGGRTNRIRVMRSQSLGGAANVNERRLNRFPAGEREGDERPAAGRLPNGRDAAEPADTEPARRQRPVENPFSAAGRRSAVELVSQADEVLQARAGGGAVDHGAAADDDSAAEQTAGRADQQSATESKTPPDIIVQMTPRGLIVASDDQEALNEFEALMGTLVDQLALTEDQPTVYWLKYIKADVASEMLTSILSGSSGGSGGDLGGGLLGEIGGGMLGGLMGLGGGGGDDSSGPVFTTTGTVSIVPDARLNALIVQANATDLRLVEDILFVIDREESPEDITTKPKPQLIPVVYQNASDVANIVKGVYSDRMPESAGGNNRQPSPEDLINALRGRGRGGRGGGGGENNKPTPISIAVDTRSNSLIVSAPPQDFLDIRDLVEQIDQSGMEMEEDVAVVQLSGNVNTQVVSSALTAILGPQATTNGAASPTSASGSSSDNNRGGQSGASASDIQRRIEFFRRLRESGGFGGRSRGGNSGRGASPFGGRGGGSGGRGGGRGGR